MQPLRSCQLPQLSEALPLGKGLTKVDQPSLEGPVGLKSLLVDLGGLSHDWPCIKPGSISCDEIVVLMKTLCN